MKIKLILLITISVISLSSLNAQKNNKKILITGTVMDAEKQPIANAIIMIDDQKTNSVTDASGNYKIKVKPTAYKITIFTFGSGTFEDSIKGRTQIDFNFGTTSNRQSPDKNIAAGDQGVNTGYGLVKKKNVTTDISNIDGTNNKYASYHTISEMIEREVSGVRISGSSVIIQDSKNLFGQIPALIVVDGVYMDALPDFPPMYVKSLQVLKGTSAAIYGSRGYGGAIVIKTKLKED
jgi:hypothetical protein